MPSINPSNAVKPMPAAASSGGASLLIGFVIGALVGGGAVWFLRSPKAATVNGNTSHVAGSANDGSGKPAEAALSDVSVYGTVTAVTSSSFTMSVSVAKAEGKAMREVRIDSSTVITGENGEKTLSLTDLQNGQQVTVIVAAEDGAKDSFTAKQVLVTSPLNAAGTLPPPPAPKGEPLTPPTAGSGSAEPVKPPTPPSSAPATTPPPTTKK